LSDTLDEAAERIDTELSEANIGLSNEALLGNQTFTSAHLDDITGSERFFGLDRSSLEEAYPYDSD
jgi:hypothetical protein